MKIMSLETSLQDKNGLVDTYWSTYYWHWNVISATLPVPSTYPEPESAPLKNHNEALFLLRKGLSELLSVSSNE